MCIIVAADFFVYYMSGCKEVRLKVISVFCVYLSVHITWLVSTLRFPQGIVGLETEYGTLHIKVNSSSSGVDA